MEEAQKGELASSGGPKRMRRGRNQAKILDSLILYYTCIVYYIPFFILYTILYHILHYVAFYHTTSYATSYQIIKAPGVSPGWTRADTKTIGLRMRLAGVSPSTATELLRMPRSQLLEPVSGPESGPTRDFRHGNCII